MFVTYPDIAAFMIIGPILAAAILAAILVLKRTVDQMIEFLLNRLEYKKRFRELVEMKERGEHHEWITMTINTGIDTHVCKKTGYCPKVNGFFNVDFVQGIARAQQQALEYEAFRNRIIADLALDNSMDLEQMAVIAEVILAIPKTYMEYIEAENKADKEVA